MPKRKLTIQEHLDALEKAGVHVKIVPPPKEEALPDIFVEEAKPLPLPQKVGSHTVKITLYAQHTISKGGHLVVKEDGAKMAEGNSIETYGPGICYVPNELVEHLLHQDLLARRSDERLLDKTQRFFLVVQKKIGNQTVNVGLETSYDPLEDLTKISQDNMFIVR